jgi:uncharacterized protein YjbI with pentapeptide repeats
MPRYATRSISFSFETKWVVRFCLCVLLVYGATMSLCQDKVQSADKDESNSDKCLLTVPGSLGGPIVSQAGVDAYLSKRMQDKAGKLVGLTFLNCKLTQDLSGRDLSGTSFINVSAIGVKFKKITGLCLGEPDPVTHLNETCTKFTECDLTNADFSDGSQLKGTQFIGPNSLSKINGVAQHPGSLSGADFQGAILDDAVFKDVDLSGANFYGANMSGVNFEPRKLPNIQNLSFADHLESLRYSRDGSALTKLHKEFSDAGLNGLKKDINFAIHRSEETNALRVCRTGKDLGGNPLGLRHLSRQIGTCFSYLIPAATLDLTCQFGKEPWRPLWIIVWLSAIWMPVLAWGLGRVRGNALLIVFKNRSGEDVSIPFTRLTRKPSKWQSLILRSKIALSLTISSVFNLPFKDLDVGRWLHMLTTRDFDYRTRGWLRSLCGCLTLLCFYMFALWIMSLFGEPFTG